MSHSSEFIAEMKEKLEQESVELQRMLGLITNSAGTAQYQEFGRNEEDNVTEIAEHVATAGTEATMKERCKNINSALERIEKKTYGVTDEGELIPEARLRANPAATDVVKPS